MRVGTCWGSLPLLLALAACSSSRSDAPHDSSAAGAGGAGTGGAGALAAGAGGSSSAGVAGVGVVAGAAGAAVGGAPDYYQGNCSPIPANAGALPHGMKLLATDVQATGGLAVAGDNAYFGTADSLQRITSSGGSPKIMVSGAKPVALGIDGNKLIWEDASDSTKTEVLSVPLDALDFAAHGAAGDAIATVLASKSGAAGAFAIAGGFVYFTAANIVSRVPSAGGDAQELVSGLVPTGVAASDTDLYVGDDDSESVAQASLPSGTVVAYKPADATPTQLVVNGGSLYLGDWFGNVEVTPLANFGSFQYFGTGCGGPFQGGCYPRHLASGGPGAVWESGDQRCSAVGTASPTGVVFFAKDISGVQSLTADATHLYANTIDGDLLRWDL